MAGTYLDVHYDKEFPLPAHGAAWVIPVSIQALADGQLHLSHDCGSFEELDHVLKSIEADIARIRKKAKRMFESR